jgi:calcium-dependent protein kinase
VACCSACNLPDSLHALPLLRHSHTAQANGSFGELDTAVIMRGVLDVLAECHSRNICYGDVKPANFLLSTADGEPTSPRAAGVPTLTVRAVDFGCSRAVAKGAPLTQQCGTPLYMAPEMAMQRFGLGVDVWAAGVMVSMALVA